MTNVPLPLLLVAAVASGAVAGAAAGVLAMPSASSNEESLAAPTLQSPSSPDAALVARIDELETENRMLEDRLADLEARPTATRAPVDGFVSRAEFDALRDELAKLGTRTVEPAAFDAPKADFEELVADTLQKVRKDEQVEGIRKYQEARTARLEQDLVKLEDWLDLEPYQVDEMRVALLDQYDRENEQRELWENGESDEVLGERKRTDGEAFQESLRGFLSEEQLATFWREISNRGGK